MINYNHEIKNNICISHNDETKIKITFIKFSIILKNIVKLESIMKLLLKKNSD